MDSAVLYNVGGVTEEVRAALKEYYDNGMVDEVDFLDAQSYDVYLYNQVLNQWRRFWCREDWRWVLQVPGFRVWDEDLEFWSFGIYRFL